MRIHRLRLANYRGVRECDIAFPSTGVTVVQGPNEVGKTSLAEALDLLLDHYDDTQKAAVRAVKPVHRDVGAEVEAELSAGPYRFTYTKRFHKDRSTTLTVHEPSPSQKTGREAHDAVRAMLAETVDEALWRAQRLVQGAGMDQPDLRDQTALARALDAAAAAPAAGDREASLYERVTEEYRRYHTATGRPAVVVKEAIADHESACHDTDLLRKQLAEVEADVDRCATLSRELAECRARALAHAERLPDLEQAWRDVRERVQEAERLRLAAELAESNLAAATGARCERHRLVTALADVEAAAAGTHTEAERATARSMAAAEALARAEAEAEQARAELRAARDASAQAHADYERARDQLDLQLLTERLDRVHLAQRQVTDAEALLEGCRIDDALRERVEAAHLEVLQARARLDGDGTTVEVEALGDATVNVDGRGPLRRGQRHARPVTEPFEVRVPDVVAVRVRPGGGVRALASALQEATARLEDLLAAGGVADVEQARAAHRRRVDARRARDEAHEALRRDLRDLTPEVLAAKVAQLRERSGAGDPDRAADLDAARRAAREAEAAVDERTRAVDRAEHTRRLAAAEAEDARCAAVEVTARREAGAATLTELRGQLEAARQEATDDALDAAVATASAAAAAAREAHEDVARQVAAADPTAVEAALDNARRVAERDADERRRLEDDLRATRTRLEVRGEDGLADKLAAAESRTAHAEHARERIQARAAAARLLYETMTARRDEARRGYVAPFRDKVIALGRVVFGPDLAVELDEDLAITSRTLDGVTVPFADLSAGAREQLSVIARLACAAITSDDGGVPLVLDDALGYSDPARLEALGAVFAMAARHAQVIVLTCMPDRYRHIGSATLVRLDAQVIGDHER